MVHVQIDESQNQQKRVRNFPNPSKTTKNAITQYASKTHTFVKRNLMSTPGEGFGTGPGAPKNLICVVFTASFSPSGDGYPSFWTQSENS